MTGSWRAVAALNFLIPLALGQYTPEPRWGQAVALLENVLYVHGGLTDQYDQYSYTSAPPTSEVFFLDLSIPFSATSPPWQLLSNTTTTSSSPALGWHSLSAFNTSSFLLFGGQPGPNSQTVLTSLNDSAALVSTSDRTDPSFVMEPQNWAGQPTRRIRHSASSNSGKVWIVGGEKADGSGGSFYDHYVFNPGSQEFDMLPSGGNAPPDIYGHASLVLPDGRLIVLGGYCVSCGDLLPMNIIWSLDTTQTTLAWDMVSVSTSTLPSPRRDFAAVVLATGEIIIHGGGDSTLQATYSDGWILNTTQNPMVWQEAQSLQQLGARKNHLAIQYNEQVLFAFGYGSSAPASAAMQIYNPSSSSMVLSYSPPPAGSTPGINSLPVPSQTGNPGSGGSGIAGSASGTAVYPGSTASADSSSNENNTIAIALGTTFGFLGLVAGGLVTVWYIKRSRERETLSHGRFFLLGGDLENESTDGGIHNFSSVRGSNEGYQMGHGIMGTGVFLLAAVFTHLGLTRHSPPEPAGPRRDMFADEDTQQFGWGSLPSMHREGSTGTSALSLRSMGAIVRSLMSREPSTGNSGRGWAEWEKIEGDREGLIHEDRLFNVMPSSGGLHGRDGSSWSYTDPFSDPVPNDTEYETYQPHLGALKLDAEYDNVEADVTSRDLSPLRTQEASLPLPAPIHTLSPLDEVSHFTASNALTSYLGSSQDNSFSKDPPASNTNSSQPSSPSQPAYGPAPPCISHTSTSTIAPSQHRLSMLNSHPPTSPTSHPVQRSDSWWRRFMKAPLLERRGSTSQRPLDFRDPNSAPRLMSIEESKASSNSPESNDNLAVKHGRLISSSVQSSRTANTEAAERLGGSYDVVQRIASDESASRRTASIRSMSANELGFVGSSEQVKLTSSSSISPPSNPHRSSNEHKPPLETGSLGSQPTRAAAHAVSSRVREFERQMTNSLEAERSPSPRNTRKREEVPSRSRPNIKYGLAPRPSLYVTNPDSSVPTS